MKSTHYTMLLASAFFAFTVLVAHAQSDFEAYRKTIMSQWEDLRSDPSGKKGTNVRWAFKVVKVNNGIDAVGAYNLVIGDLDTHGQMTVVANVRSRAEGSRAQPVKVDDWVIVEGKFDRVNEHGVIILENVRLTNSGYRGLGDSPK